MAQTFQQRFGAVGDDSTIAVGVAPGTINLLGSHTSYNDGFAVAIATPQKTMVEVAESRDDFNHFCVVGRDRTVTCAKRGEIEEDFAMSLFGCMEVLQQRNFPVSPVCALVRSKLPVGAGLSDNAAMDVAMIRALGRLFGFRLDEISLARMGNRVELEYAGVSCGIIDQMASIVGDPDQMLVLDSRSLESRLLPLPEGSELVVVDSGVPSAFVRSHIERKLECQEACRRLSVSGLRDVTDPALLAALPQPLQKRARHIVTENIRIFEAASGVPARRFGELLNESQGSLRDDYEVSSPELDLVAELLRDDPRTYGSRLTGAGLGGACVALVEAGTGHDVGVEIVARYEGKGGKGRLLVPEA